MLVARAGYGHIREVLLALFGGAEDLEEGGDGGVVVVPREVILRGTRLRRLHLAHLQEIGRCPGSDIVARGQQAIVALGQKAIVALGQKIVALGQTIVALKVSRQFCTRSKSRSQVTKRRRHEHRLASFTIIKK